MSFDRRARPPVNLPPVPDAVEAGMIAAHQDAPTLSPWPLRLAIIQALSALFRQGPRRHG